MTALGLAASIGAANAGEPVTAELIGRHIWSETTVGGLSGLELSDDGAFFIAISDRGTRHEGTFQRDNGKITGLTPSPPTAIRKMNGQPVEAHAVDAEGLACATPAPAAPCDISFEVIHRVAFFATPDAAARNRPRSAAIKGLQNNSGLEALAVDPQGRLLAIPERSGALDRPFPVYRLDGKRWTTPFHIRRAPPHLVVGADFGPDGKLYVLERHFATIAFASRVRRFTIDGDQITDEETVLTTPLGRFDNLEGLAVWQDASGAIRLTMVSDDNFNRFQRTEFVEYRLRPPAADG